MGCRQGGSLLPRNLGPFYREINSLLTDLVSLVRYALKQDDNLIPFPDRVKERFEAWLTNQQSTGAHFTAEQIEWAMQRRASAHARATTEVAAEMVRLAERALGARVEGSVRLDGIDIYDPEVDPVQLRRVIGMVFQRPNPFPTMSIFDNVAAGLRLTGRLPKGHVQEVVERSLRRAALWDEVKDKLRANGTSLSGGQQQRLCIARALAVDPEVILMDEPASALDPIATLRIEELIAELREAFTIVIVTHNMQQASRVSDQTAFFTMGEDRAGYLVEMDDTVKIFTNPTQSLTEDYVSGRFG